MNERDEARLCDMRDAAEHASIFIQGKSREALEEQNELLGFALTRAIEIIGEAASQISPETRALFPQIPWKSVVGMRNLVIHEYFSVDYDVIWKVAVEDVPVLLDALNEVLPNED